jgi:hypothetical protein
MNLELAIQKAEKGLAWLRESGSIYGLNVDEVNLWDLDLSSTCGCVLGQLGGHYNTAVNMLVGAGVISPGYDATNTWLTEHGFEQSIDTQYHELNRAWTQILEADRAQ